MLGRLGMTVQECIPSLFRRTPTSNGGCVYSAERLEAVFHGIIARHASSSVPSSRLPMKDDKIADRCKTFIVSRYESDAVVSTEMRTYDVPHAARFAAQYAVWKAARATSSDPNFFPPIVIGNTKYVAMGNNNPAALAIDESKRIWGERSQVACLVSLGSGLAQAVSLGHTMAEIEQAVNAIVEDCSRVANQVKMTMQEQRLGHRYHPFSDHTVESIKREEWERTQVVVGLRRRFPLPPPRPCFGREAEIQLAREAILSGRHVAIVGGAGNGKSTVALDTLHAGEIKRAFAADTREDLRFW
ncbi:hypothetical protein BT69DRAFT_1306812, partial [Atractiella rhizophila]